MVSFHSGPVMTSPGVERLHAALAEVIRLALMEDDVSHQKVCIVLASACGQLVGCIREQDLEQGLSDCHEVLDQLAAETARQARLIRERDAKKRASKGKQA